MDVKTYMGSIRAGNQTKLMQQLRRNFLGTPPHPAYPPLDLEATR